jgi:hypothetical protein
MGNFTINRSVDILKKNSKKSLLSEGEEFLEVY